MPLAREAAKRKAAELALPAKGEDAAERKRVLNVLAQRRYRQRRKEHVKNLEAQAGQARRVSETSTILQLPPTDDTSTAQSPGEELTQSGSENVMPGSEDITPNYDVFASPETYFPQPGNFQPDAQGQAFEDPFAMFDPNFVAFPSDLQPDWNQLPSIPSSPISTTDPSNLSLISLSSSRSSSKPPTDVQYSFPDEAHLEVLELNLLRGAVAIAKRLNIEDLIWSLTSTSPFTAPSMALAEFRHLPPNLRPTVTQMAQPHHPILDLLPWPTVRDKLILVFTQPPELRPPSAASPTALMEFVYDIEDSAEGVRIWGEDPYSDQSWEVGEKVFRNWWWAFDSDVIRRSNEMRKRRGARLLGMEQGSVLGEVA